MNEVSKFLVTSVNASVWSPGVTLSCPQSRTVRPCRPANAAIVRAFCLARYMLRYEAPARL